MVRKRQTETQESPLTRSFIVSPENLHTATATAAIHRSRQTKNVVTDVVAASIRKRHTK